MEDLVLVAVVAFRFDPALDPKAALQAIVAALVIDAENQTIFAAFNVESENYPGYEQCP